MRGVVEPSPKGDFVVAAAAGCGFVYALLIPFHGLLRAVTDNPFILGWKEAVLGVGLMFGILYGVKQRTSNVWHIVSVTLVLMLSYVAMSSVDADLQIVADGVITMFGPLCVGIFYWIAFSNAVTSGRTPKTLFVILGLAGLLAIWIAAEDRLGLTQLTTGDEDLAFFTREGITRARASFDSPMSAGQWLWFHAVVAFGCALCEARARAGLLLLALAVLMVLGVLFTGSRGPYALVLISVVVFAALAAISRRLNVLVSFSVLLAALALLAVPWVVGVVLQDNAAALGDIAGSILNPDESANLIRAERWKAGWHTASENLIWGAGIEKVSLKHLVATGNIFENTFLDTTVALGLAGLCYVFAWYAGVTLMVLANQARLRQITPLVLLSLGFCLWMPWGIYGLAYPTLNARISAAISWALLGVVVSLFQLRASLKH
jgi:O-antigen ligase